MHKKILVNLTKAKKSALYTLKIEHQETKIQSLTSSLAIPGWAEE